MIPRLSHSLIPFSLLLLLVSANANDAQQTLHSPTTQTTTLIDVLNDDPDYTSLLKLLQLARLVPTLNRIKQATLFAPTNDAISRHQFWTDALDAPPGSIRDNVQEQLRQELFYHILNYTITSLPTEQDPQVHKTLLFPRKLPDKPSHEPPPSPPWMPVPSGTLGGEPQRLRLSQQNGQLRVGVDESGQGGTTIVKGRVDAGNGILLGVNDVLLVPPDLFNVSSKQDSLSYFTKIIKPTIEDMLRSKPELTLFLPVDTAWDVLPKIERMYLESEYATDDIMQVLGMHAVVTEGVHWSDSFQPSRNLTTISGSTLEITVSPESGKTMVSSAELVQQDIYASNGVLHTISSLLIPLDALKITPEKYLLTFNCKSFVSMIHSVDLTSLINSTTDEYTILAPKDEVMKLFMGDGDSLPEKGTPELKRLLSYHFLPGKWKPEKLKDGMLIETVLEENGLNGARQVVDIAVSKEGGKQKERSIRFAGASILGDSIENDNIIYYFISRPLLPPTDVLQTALPNLDFSTFLAGIFSTSLAEQLKATPSSTFLIPVNDAFKRLGALVSAHLLQATSKADLENVILHHVIKGVEYTKSFESGSAKSYGTHEGTDLRAYRPGNGSVYLSASGGWEGMSAEITTMNMLTQTGVIHQLSDVLLPRSVDLTIGKLVKAGKGSTMATMVTRAEMEWLLNGTAPPDGSPWADPIYEGVGWTLLCPTDEAFKGYNLTHLYEDTQLLRDIVEQHIIPLPPPNPDKMFQAKAFQTNQPLPLIDSATYSTLHSKESAYGDIVLRQGSDGDGGVSYFVGIKGAAGTETPANWARVVSWGRSTTYGGIGGVIQINQLLSPYRPPWYVEYGAPTTVGIFGVVLICLFFLGVRAFWRRDTTEATYEPIGGFGQGDDEP